MTRKLEEEQEVETVNIRNLYVIVYLLQVILGQTQIRFIPKQVNNIAECGLSGQGIDFQN